METILLWLGAISALAALVTCYDKIASKRRLRRRVPEATLLLLAALGGSAAMLLTMLLIRHKTRHLKFMLGLPLLLLVQVGAFAFFSARGLL